MPPEKIAKSQNCHTSCTLDGSVGPGPGVQDHLPESCCQVDCTEELAARSAHFPDAFANVLHRVFVSVGHLIEGPEDLHLPDAVVFLRDGEDGAVVVTVCRLYDSEFEKFENTLFDIDRFSSF